MYILGTNSKRYSLYGVSLDVKNVYGMRRVLFSLLLVFNHCDELRYDLLNC